MVVTVFLCMENQIVGRMDRVRDLILGEGKPERIFMPIYSKHVHEMDYVVHVVSPHSFLRQAGLQL